MQMCSHYLIVMPMSRQLYPDALSAKHNSRNFLRDYCLRTCMRPSVIYLLTICAYCFVSQFPHIKVTMMMMMTNMCHLYKVTLS